MQGGPTAKNAIYTSGAMPKKSTPVGGNPEQLTPMMQQFFGVKHQHPDAIVLFRMGDFFETFYEDAEIASKLLEITLTARGKNAGGDPIPMAGVPVHSIDGYIARLVNLGHKVAVCDQIEDARQAKGLVKRGVTRVATPGTTADAHTVGSKENVFLLALVRREGQIGFGFTDLSTGRLDVSEVAYDDAAGRLADEVARYQPREVLYPSGSNLADLLPPDHRAALTERPADLAAPEQAAERLRRHLGVSSLSGFGLDGRPAATAAAGLLFAYLDETQKASLAHVRSVSYLDAGDYLTLDASTVRNLELTRSLLDGSTHATLLEVVDRTRTPMGARLLRERLLRPSRKLDVVEAWLEAVEALHGEGDARTRVRDQALARIHDLERLLSRVSLQKSQRTRPAGATRLVPVASPTTHARPSSRPSPPHTSAPLAALRSTRFPSSSTCSAKAIDDDAPVSLKDGGLIKKGWDSEARRAARHRHRRQVLDRRL